MLWVLRLIHMHALIHGRHQCIFFRRQRCHDDVIKWKHFPRYWPFVRGIHRSPMNSPHKGQWRAALMFCFFICAWMNGWVNNREAGDLRRHRAHYDVTVMYQASWCAGISRKLSAAIMNDIVWCWKTYLEILQLKEYLSEIHYILLAFDSRCIVFVVIMHRLFSQYSSSIRLLST